MDKPSFNDLRALLAVATWAHLRFTA